MENCVFDGEEVRGKQLHVRLKLLEVSLKTLPQRGVPGGRAPSQPMGVEIVTARQCAAAVEADLFANASS